METDLKGNCLLQSGGLCDAEVFPEELKGIELSAFIDAEMAPTL